ncbi:thiopurine S-methyltransferase [Mytilus galloprovincialis]|uniref:thiopurine S-methyltransferase n=1 Tax=Mytilus galloprovincialis TaxID=29158 RepID=A0A8B6FQG1_MYTGA|nr:thiopurine S-methyltransferase [Mytilus galloprovincialis]
MEEDYTGDVTVDEWRQLWKDGKTDFINPELSPMFTKHVDKMLNSREKVKTFVPFCGKVVEMKWLWNKGHEVVGVECGEEAIKDFFTENKIDYSIVEVPEVKGKLYKSDDGRIRLYCCDFYLFNSAIQSSFEAVWDSGALNAVNLDDQEKYVNIIKSLMGNKCINPTVADELSVTCEKLRNWFNGGFRVVESDFMKPDEKLESFGFTGLHLYTISKI